MRRLPTSHQWVVELRHAAFFDRGHAHLTLDEAFVAADIGRVVLDTRPLYSAPALTTAAEEERRTKPHLAVHTEVMGRAPIVRVIGAGDRAATIDGLRAWVPTVVRWLRQGFEPFVFAHQPENLESPDLARAFHHMIRSEVPELTPLPDPSPVDDDGEIAGQATLI